MSLSLNVYLTCINFWKFHDHLKACLEVIRLQSWLKTVKFSVKMQFFMFLTPWKIHFWINGKSEIWFFWAWTWKCSHYPQGYPENAPNHILSSNSTGKVLKMAIESEPLGLCIWNFWNFYSQWDYLMMNISRILKFLTWHGYD